MDFTLDEEHEQLQRMVRDFAQNEVAPKAAERDEKDEFDRGLFTKMGELGLTGIPWPETYDGAEMDYLAYVIAVEELSKVCASTGVALSAHTSLGSWPIYKFGTEEQKKKYLSPLAQGTWIGAFGLTESGAGSDPAGMKTTARRDGDGYILNGSKIFITNGGCADVVVVFAVTDSAKGSHGISAFIVEKGTPGFAVGKKEDKMGIRGSSTTELIFEDCHLPSSQLLGEEGEGLKVALMTLDGGRSGIAAQALGIAGGALELARSYALERRQFGRRIADFQAIQFKLADMATQVEAARLLTYKAACLESTGQPYSIASAMSKVFASDTAMAVTTEAVQILGGYGYTKDYPAERMMRDAKITQIYEGTNEIQRVVIARSMLPREKK